MCFKGRILISLQSAKVLWIILPGAKSQRLGISKKQQQNCFTPIRCDYNIYVNLSFHYFSVHKYIPKFILVIGITGTRCTFAISEVGDLMVGFNFRITTLTSGFHTNLN